MLMGADITQCGDLAIMANQADRITRRPHPLQNGSLGQIDYRGDGLELGFAPDRVKNGS